jgi:23S rRNA pseudouridine1911/1915/1917 synthase
LVSGFWIIVKKIVTKVWAGELPILWEDEAVIIINKPAGVLAHGAPTQGESVDVVTLLQQQGVVLMGGSTDRPGVIHRLDQYTEGLMMLAKSDQAYDHMQAQFKARAVTKRYYAVVKGLLPPSGRIDRPIGRDVSVRARRSCHHYVSGTQKEAITVYTVLRQLTNLSVVDVQLITGRTHQIRVHFAAINCPVLGDHLYSRQSKKPEGYYLQSYHLTWHHPYTNECITTEIPPSNRLKKYVQ